MPEVRISLEHLMEIGPSTAAQPIIVSLTLKGINVSVI